jgi:hypothetical protein
MTPASRFSTIAIAEIEGQINAANQAGRPTRSGNVPDEAAYAACPRSDQRWQEVGSGTGFIRGYCLSDAAYFASLGEPPATQAFRGGLAVLGKYVDVLIFLAEGRNLEELHAQLDSLSSTIGQVLAFLPGGGAAAGPAIGGALGALKPLIDAAAQQGNDQEIKRLVLAGAPHARQLIDRLRDAAPLMFNVLTASAARAAVSPAALDIGYRADRSLSRDGFELRRSSEWAADRPRQARRGGPEPGPDGVRGVSRRGIGQSAHLCGCRAQGDRCAQPGRLIRRTR